jgi:hypothetical protein
LFVILGHMFPVWLRFKGGKGVATAFGAFLALCPWAALSAFGLWALWSSFTRYVSLASILAAVGASLSDPVAVTGQVRIHIRRGCLRLLLDGHREALAQHPTPAARHGASLFAEERRMSRVAIVGSGSWGTALALSLARRGDHSIALWSHSAAVADSIRKAG